MNLRLLLPRSLRWKCAHRWVVRAEAAEAMMGLTEKEDMRDAYAHNAMGHYLRALQWYPIQHVRQLPPPSDLGSHPVDEQLWPEALSAGNRHPHGWATVPCILCGTPIPQARMGKTATEGRYCTACAG